MSCQFSNIHSKHFHAWVSVWFNMAQRTGEPRVLRSWSSRVIPPSSSQTEDADICASLGMSAPATDARSDIDKQDFLDSILSSMQEQQRLMTFLIERIYTDLLYCVLQKLPSATLRGLPKSRCPSRFNHQLCRGLPKLRCPSRFNHQLCRGLPKLRRPSRFNHQLCRLHLPTQGQVIQSSSQLDIVLWGLPKSRRPHDSSKRIKSSSFSTRYRSLRTSQVTSSSWFNMAVGHAFPSHLLPEGACCITHFTITTCTCLSHSQPAPVCHTHHLHLSTFTYRTSIKLLSTVVSCQFSNIHSKHFHAWVSVWFNSRLWHC